MNKLNSGCGTRIAASWINIDFHSQDSRVKRVNLLSGFPFHATFFDYACFSHVLEHFAPEDASFLLSEAYRVLKPGGVVRIVFLDLENASRQYLRILELSDSDPAKSKQYEWIKIELLDQMVRSFQGGLMGRFIQ
jgi:predicted SAM-dependent methyltransferase